MSPRVADERPRLSDADLVRMMGLIKEADSVELKVTVPADFHSATIRNVGLDPVEAQPRQVFFFDTPDLALDKAGVVVRARRIQGGRADTVVKLRPVEPSTLPDEIRHSAAFNVEVDVLPGGFVCSGSMKGRSTGAEVRDAVAGTLAVRKLFTKEQRAFFAAHAPAGIDLDALEVLGPTFILKGTFIPKALDRRFVVEMWLYQDGSRILELSTKCLPSEAFQVAAEARAYLADRGVTIFGVQRTKTRTALEFFQHQLQQAAADAAAPATVRKRRATTPAKPAKARSTRTAKARTTTRAAAAKSTAAKSTAANSTAAKSTAAKSTATKRSAAKATAATTTAATTTAAAATTSTTAAKATRAKRPRKTAPKAAANKRTSAQNGTGSAS